MTKDDDLLTILVWRGRRRPVRREPTTGGHHHITSRQDSIHPSIHPSILLISQLSPDPEMRRPLRTGRVMMETTWGQPPLSPERANRGIFGTGAPATTTTFSPALKEENDEEEEERLLVVVGEGPLPTIGPRWWPSWSLFSSGRTAHMIMILVLLVAAVMTSLLWFGQHHHHHHHHPWLLLADHDATGLAEGVRTEPLGSSSSSWYYAGFWARKGKRKNWPVVDMISIGTWTNPAALQAQQLTLGRHPSVRNFFPITEHNDTETACPTNLTLDRLRLYVQHCQSFKATSQDPPFPYMNLLKKSFAGGGSTEWLLSKPHPIGWLCAQKRPVDGFYAVLQQYRQQYYDYHQKTGTTTAVAALPNDDDDDVWQAILPDYLVLMDDDTWIHMDRLWPVATRLYPSHQPYVVAGCLMRHDIFEQNMTNPFGGYGTLMTRAALLNWLRPLPNCSHTALDHHHNNNKKNNNNNTASILINSTTVQDFVRHACARLQQNLIGERPYFQAGMSVADLMYQLAAQHPLVVPNAPQDWGNPGYCMHSDVALSYFINMYNIPRHSDDPVFAQTPEDRLRGFQGSSWYFGKAGGPSVADLGLNENRGGECHHGDLASCPADQATFCHHISPQAMQSLYRATEPYHWLPFFPLKGYHHRP